MCWRLARQLALTHGARVTLWIDQPETLRAIAPQAATGDAPGVRLRRWSLSKPPIPSPLASGERRVVVSAFSCALPPAVRASLIDEPRTLWVDLEYLSAEPWVEGCHGLPSTKPADGAVEHFFYPGFTPATGGLLRERGLIEAREAFQSTRASEAWLAAHDLAAAPGERLISLFCYPDAPVRALLEVLAQGDRPSRVLVPVGIADAQLSDFIGRPLPPGTEVRLGRLTIRRFALLDQDAYDRLLWSCDLNFVRGEDSWVRAHWAGRPFVWQAYPQAARAQAPKVEAFLQRFEQAAGPAPEIREAMRAWNGETPAAPALTTLARQLDTLAPVWRRWVDTLIQQRDLADQLVEFCLNRL